MQELFNLCYAQAQNVVEHIFGVIKKQWVILVLLSQYNMDLQAYISAALCTLHNFILDKNINKHYVNQDIADPKTNVFLLAFWGKA